MPRRQRARHEHRAPPGPLHEQRQRITWSFACCPCLVLHDHSAVAATPKSPALGFASSNRFAVWQRAYKAPYTEENMEASGKPDEARDAQSPSAMGVARHAAAAGGAGVAHSALGLPMSVLGDGTSSPGPHSSSAFALAQECSSATRVVYWGSGSPPAWRVLATLAEKRLVYRRLVESTYR
jgi:hypothetical protein